MTPPSGGQRTRLARGTELPPVAIVLDIDGVIAPIGGPTAWDDDVTAGDPEHGLRLSPSMCAAVDRIDEFGQAGRYWLTDWTQRMRHDRELLPGRTWPVVADSQAGHLRAEEWAGEWWDALPWWKWWALDEWLSTHPGIRRLVWIDDHLRPRSGRSQPCQASMDHRERPPGWGGSRRAPRCARQAHRTPTPRPPDHW